MIYRALLNDPVVNVSLNLTSAANVVATAQGYLPEIAALVTIVWMGLQIYDYFRRKK